MKWDDFTHWKQRQLDMFKWWKGMSPREIMRWTHDAVRSSLSDNDMRRRYIYGEWPEGDIRRMGDRSRV